MSATDMIEVAHTVNLPATAVFFGYKKDKKFKGNLQITSRAQKNSFLAFIFCACFKCLEMLVSNLSMFANGQ